MALLRIQLSRYAAGTSPYTFVFNPSDVELPRILTSENVEDVKSIDGDAVSFTPYFDSRRGHLLWKGYPADHAGFSAQLSTLVALEGKERYINMRDLGTAIGHYTSWTRIRIVGVDRRLRQGGAFVFDSVDLVFEETEGTGDCAA